MIGPSCACKVRGMDWIWVAAIATLSTQVAADCVIPAGSGVANGGTELCANGNTIPEFAFCQTTCKTGYTAAPADGYDEISPFCTFGELYPPSYTCQEDSCALPTRIPGSDIVVHPTQVCYGIDPEDKVPPGEYCMAQCKDGWTADTALLYCKIGVLTPDTFTCFPQTCDSPEGVENSVCAEGRHGDNCAPSCAEGSAIDHMGFCTPLCAERYRAKPPGKRPVTPWRWLMWDVTKVRGADDVVSVEELNLFNGNASVSKSGVEAWTIGGSSPGGEEPQKLFDAESAYPAAPQKWKNNGVFPLILKYSAAVFTDGFSFMTNSEDPDWDPIRWQMKGSVDGIAWTVLHDQSTDADTPFQTWLESDTFHLMETALVVGDRVRLSPHENRVKEALAVDGLPWESAMAGLLGEVLTVIEVPVDLNKPLELSTAGIVLAGFSDGTGEAYLFPQTDILELQIVMSCFEGSYTPSTFVCEGVPCDSPTNIDWGLGPPCVEGWEIEHGQPCTTRCDNEAGYYTSHDELICDRGQLVPQTFDCVWGRCSAPSLEMVPMSAVPSCAEGLKIEDKQNCTTVCQWGYTATVATLNCDTAVLSPRTFECIEDSCPAPVGILNVSADGACEEGASIAAGEVCTSTCQEGFTASSKLLSCSRGKLSPVRFSCSPSKCSAPQVQNSQNYACSEGTIIRHGFNCTTACEFGYITNHVTLSCMYGVLDPLTFICEEASCPIPVDLIDDVGDPACEEGVSLIKTGQICTPRCRSGYIPTEAAMYCDLGNLIPESFACVGQPCPVPAAGLIENAASQPCAEHEAQVAHGASCTAQCADGFSTLVDQLKCSATRLNPPKFICVPNSVFDAVALLDDSVLTHSPTLHLTSASLGGGKTLACYQDAREMRLACVYLLPSLGGVRSGPEITVESNTQGRINDLVIAPFFEGQVVMCYSTRARPLGVCQLLGIVTPDDVQLVIFSPDGGLDLVPTGETQGASVVRHLTLAVISPGKLLLCYQLGSIKVSCRVIQGSSGGRRLQDEKTTATTTTQPPIYHESNGIFYDSQGEKTTATTTPWIYQEADGKVYDGDGNRNDESPYTYTDLTLNEGDATTTTTTVIDVVFSITIGNIDYMELMSNLTLKYAVQDVIVESIMTVLHVGTKETPIEYGAPEVSLSAGSVVANCMVRPRADDFDAAAYVQTYLENSNTSSLLVATVDANVSAIPGIQSVKSVTSAQQGLAYYYYYYYYYVRRRPTMSVTITAPTLLVLTPSPTPPPIPRVSIMPDRLSAAALHLVMLSEERAVFCLVDASLGRQGVCYLVAIEGSSAVPFYKLTVNEGATAYFAAAELGEGRAILCFSDWQQDEIGICRLLGLSEGGEAFEVGPRNIVAANITRYTRLATMSKSATDQRVLLYHQTSRSLGHSPVVCSTLTAPVRDVPNFKAFELPWYVDDQMLMYPNHGNENETGLAFSGAAAALDGRIIFAPFDANTIVVMNSSAPSVQLINISGITEAAKKFSGAAVTGDGVIVFAPYDATAVGIFAPPYNDSINFSMVDISDQASGAAKYNGAASSNDGVVIFAPCMMDAVGVFNPATSTLELVDITRAFMDVSCWFNEAILSPNGNIIFAPCDAPFVGVFAPPYDASSLFTTVDITENVAAFLDSAELFRGAVLTRGGQVIFCPGSALQVGVFNPESNRYLPIDLSRDYEASTWRGAVASSDGKAVLFAPSIAGGSVAKFDLATYAFSTFDPGTAGDKVVAYRGASIGIHGRMVFYPPNSTSFGLLFSEIPTVIAELSQSATEDVQTGIAWNLGLSALSSDTALACYADTYMSEKGRCKVLWIPSFQKPGEGPIVCHGQSACA